ncbi:response regulator [uncultured Desulfosarcina sp.]|uniref:response regulator n=1 Tax=uncultured Desulfosarcina sp. TaxID=218289 RepID=UPI0029C7A196|nr:response regulator [uncultured Desulfosarcina sp.]
MKIMIVDDERVSRIKMQQILKGYGECHAVENGLTAIKSFTEALLDEKPFDLITLDISMPDLGGPEVLESIRKLESKNGITVENRSKILMVTAHSDYPTVVASIEAGCNDYIKKPFSEERVLLKLNKMNLA